MDDLARDVFEMGARLNQAQAEMLRAGGRVVFLLWNGSTLLGICATQERADTEAEELGRTLNTVIRLERRVVHE